MKNFIAGVFLLLFSIDTYANLPQVSWRESDLLSSKVEAAISDNEKHKPDTFTEILFESKISINTDKVTYTHLYVYYFPDTKSTQIYGADSLPFNNDLDKVQIHFLGTRQKDGAYTSIKQSDLKFNDVNTYNTFSSAKQAVFNYPALSSGDYGVMYYTVTRDIKSQESDFSRELGVQISVPRKNIDISVEWNTNASLVWHNRSKLLKCHESVASLRCTAKDIPKVEQDDYFYWMDEVDFLQIGVMNSWDQVIAKARSKFDLAVSGYDQQINKFIQSHFSANDSLEKKLDKLHEYVSQEIQYVSHSEHGNSITPHPVIRTLESKFGDCKDKSALFYALLKKLNLDPIPVLVSTKRVRADHLNVPSLNYFDHMIICFDYKGTNYCSDLTDATSDWRFLSPGIQGKVMLKMAAGNRPARLPKADQRWHSDIETELIFQRDGSQVEKTHRMVTGEYGNVMRGNFYAKTKSEREKWLLDQYQRAVSNKVEPVFDIVALDNVFQPLEIHYEATHVGVIGSDVDSRYTEYDPWVVLELKDSRLGDIKYDVEIPGYLVYSVTKIQLPSEWSFKYMPANLNLRHRFGALQRKSTFLDDGLEITTTLDIPAQKIKKADAEEYNKFLDVLIRESDISTRLITKSK